jgi:hypothetical protein
MDDVEHKVFLTRIALEQFMLTLAYDISEEILRIFCFLAKRQRAGAVQDASRISRNHRVTRSVLECGGPPPLFPETYQTAPRLIETAIIGTNFLFFIRVNR